MANMIKYGAWLILAVTTLATLLAGKIIYGLQTGTTENSGAGFSSLFLTTWLGVFGLIALIYGVVGYFNAKRAKVITPLVASLNAVMGALALLMILYMGAI